MILGLDVGGTQTDTVLIDKNGVFYESKTPTGDNLLETLALALDKTLTNIDPTNIERMTFSTTMATNAIVQGLLADTGMIVSAGPGMDPALFSVGPSYHVVEGCLDHQGLEAMPVNKEAVLNASDLIRQDGIKLVGIVTKFSVRNPAHELLISDWVKNSFSHIALGHQVSGALNFPRRITTTYLNAALYGLHQEFINAVIRTIGKKDLQAPRFLLKPDGGTVGLEQSLYYPAGTAQSGPAASVMGALALDGCKGNSIVLDIGGTTTDMSVVLNGVPLLARHGIMLGPFQTLVRSLLTRSIGMGGDSEIQIEKNGNLKIGPLRKGSPVAFGGNIPTPTDAMITLDLIRIGNGEAARDAMEKLAVPLGLTADKMAHEVLKHTAQSIAVSVNDFIGYINSRPLYTIHEVVQEKKIIPDSVVIIGGPAPQFADYVGKALGLPYRVPSHFGVANAVGAAVARVTSEISLQADTQRGTVVIPEADVQDKIASDFSLEDASSLAREVIKKQALQAGADPSDLDITITEKEMFNMIRGYSRTGRNIRLKMSIVPGIIPEWNRRKQDDTR